MQIHQLDILDHPNGPGSLGQVFGTAPSFQQMEAGYGRVHRPRILKVEGRERRLESGASFDLGFPWFSVLRPLDTLLPEAQLPERIPCGPMDSRSLLLWNFWPEPMWCPSPESHWLPCVPISCLWHLGKNMNWPKCHQSPLDHRSWIPRRRCGIDLNIKHM